MSPLFSFPTTSMSSTTYHYSRRSSVAGGKRRAPREVRFGVYVLGATLGEGEFGKVKLGWRKDGQQPSQAAIKLIRRDSVPHGSEKESKIHREINALKRLRHPNIVRLVEVLQNEKYIGIVLEYASGGELFDYILEHRYLKEGMACRLFAQLVSGVDYMHSKGLVHRDLKLENLLLDKHKNIIISDFGFVNSFHSSSNDMMRTSCGSPCYAAPELVISSEPYRGTKVDVWSCGVILYAMLAGYLPFDDDPQNPDGENIARLYHYITKTPLTFPEYIPPTPRDLLRKIIVPDPHKRISLKQVRSHTWLSPHAPFLSVTPSEWDRNYKAARILVSQPDKAHRRYSLMENPTSASLMLNKHSVKSYTSNVSKSLYAHPAAPQTSRTFAVSGSSSSSDLSGASTAAVEAYRSFNTHQRSGSSASLALQAVVEADDAEHTRRNSVTDQKRVRPFPRPLTLANVSQEVSSPASFVPLDTLIGVSTAGIDTIREDSERNSANLSSNVSVPPRSTRTGRPRPTSYHPGMGAVSQITAHDLAFMGPLTSRSRSPSPARSTHSKRGSWGAPKISEPTLDMSMVTGVLTRLNDAAAPKSEKRRSIALETLNNAMETMETMETENPEPKEISVQAKAEPESESKVTETVESEKKAEPVVKPVAEPVAKSVAGPVVEPVAEPVIVKPASKSSKADESEVKEYKPTDASRKSSHSSHTSAHSSQSKGSEKENRTSSTNKFKRFSLLSFYTRESVYETANEHDHRRESRIPEGREVNTTTRKATDSSRKADVSRTGSHRRRSERKVSERRPLEPRNQVEIPVTRTPTSSSQMKEPSTAKRVMDFFRRRSVRI